MLDNLVFNLPIEIGKSSPLAKSVIPYSLFCCSHFVDTFLSSGNLEFLSSLKLHNTGSFERIDACDRKIVGNKYVKSPIQRSQTFGMELSVNIVNGLNP